ncbi:MAG TPA: DUF4446 family protein [Candidatus Limnocylindria bacterium]|nr:DUF4446 family protein [Candidatus Limnocylindria bacterium]
MPELNRLLADNLALAFAATAAIVALVLLAVVVLAARLGRATRRYEALVRAVEPGPLGDVLEAHVARVSRALLRLDELERLHRTLDDRSGGSLRHVGVVRFNPFDDTGSDQSFAIALLDDRRDGVVISSLHGRSSTRVFAKRVENGESRHALSDEERQAIRVALDREDAAPAIARAG